MDYKIYHEAFTIISGSTADDFTDSEGKAKFSSISVLASNMDYIYLALVANGVVTAPLSSNYDLIPPYLPEPIKLLPKGSYVTILQGIDQ